MHLPPNEEGNYMLNSVNKQRSLYPMLYDEHDRMNAKDAKKAAMKDTMKVLTKPSTFLISEFHRDDTMRKRKKIIYFFFMFLKILTKNKNKKH